MSYDGSYTSYASSYSSDDDVSTDSKITTNTYYGYTNVQSYSSDEVYTDTYIDHKYGGTKTETYDYSTHTTTYSETGYNPK